MDEFLNELIDKLELNLNLFAPVSIGMLSSASKSIALRLMPVPAGAGYQNGQRERSVLFQMLTKSPNQMEALLMLEAIGDELETMGVQTYSEPNYLEFNGKEWLYTAAYRTEFIKGDD